MNISPDKEVQAIVRCTQLLDETLDLLGESPDYLSEAEDQIKAYIPATHAMLIAIDSAIPIVLNCAVTSGYGDYHRKCMAVLGLLLTSLDVHKVCSSRQNPKILHEGASPFIDANKRWLQYKKSFGI